MSTYEDRPGWAACFPPRNSKVEHPADFTGVMVIEGVDGRKKFWVNVYKKLDRNGNEFVSVNLRPLIPASTKETPQERQRPG